MNKAINDFESTKKKLEKLDSEINTFLQTMEEVKEIRNTIETLPEQIKHNEIQIENQKKEFEVLISSTNNFLIDFEEKANGVFYDLDRGINDLKSEFKSRLSDFSNDGTKDELKEKLDQISNEYKRMQTFYEIAKNIEPTLKSLKEHVSVLKDDQFKFSNVISDIQKSRFEINNKISVIEEELKALFFEKLKKQNKIMLTIFAIFMISAIFFVLNPFS
jgi:chromosome segregation ATPase